MAMVSDLRVISLTTCLNLWSPDFKLTWLYLPWSISYWSQGARIKFLCECDLFRYDFIDPHGKSCASLLQDIIQKKNICEHFHNHKNKSKEAQMDILLKRTTLISSCAGP